MLTCLKTLGEAEARLAVDACIAELAKHTTRSAAIAVSRYIMAS